MLSAQKSITFNAVTLFSVATIRMCGRQLGILFVLMKASLDNFDIIRHQITCSYPKGNTLSEWEPNQCNIRDKICDTNRQLKLIKIKAENKHSALTVQL